MRADLRIPIEDALCHAAFTPVRGGLCVRGIVETLPRNCDKEPSAGGRRFPTIEFGFRDETLAGTIRLLKLPHLAKNGSSLCRPGLVCGTNYDTCLPGVSMLSSPSVRATRHIQPEDPCRTAVLGNN